MQQPILLTGAAGFIGSVILKELNVRGQTEVFLVDDLGEDQRWKNLVGKQFVEFIPIQELFTWLPTAPPLRAIIHLGACSSTVETHADYLFENNTRYSQRLATYAMEHHIRFIYASSAATYGDGSLGFSEDLSLLPQYAPLNMYGLSKHWFDLWLYRKGWLQECVGLKYFNVFGPNEFHKGRMSSAIVKMVQDLQQGAPIRLFCSSEPDRFSDGEQVRDFIYVKDVARMTLQFLSNAIGGLFNIGAGEPASWNRLARAVCHAIGVSPRIEYIPMPLDLVGKYQNYTCASMENSRRHQLEQPLYSLEQAVLEYVQEYLIPQRCY